MAGGNLNLSGFTGQPDNADWLYQLGDTLQKNKFFDERAAERKQLLQQRESEKKLATTKFINDIYDPASHFSGTIYDHQITKGYSGLLTDALSLLNNGVTDPALIQSTLAGRANQIAQYSAKAKTINDNINKRIQDIPANSGYNKEQLRRRALNAAFGEQEVDFNELGNVDESKDYVGEAVKKYPLDVTDNTGLLDFVKNYDKTPNVIKTKSINKAGGSEMRDLEVTAPHFMVLKKDAQGRALKELEPEHDLVQDGEIQLTHPTTKEPIKMVKQGLFNAVLGRKDSYADRLRGEVEQHIQSGDYKDANGNPITIDSPHADLLARTLLFKDLEDMHLGGVKDVTVSKENPIHFTNNTYLKTGDLNYNDVFEKLHQKAQIAKDEYAKGGQDAYTNAVNFEDLDQDEQKLVKDQIALSDKAIEGENIKVILTPDDKMGIFKKDDGMRIGYISKTANIKANQALGQKVKQRALNDAQPTTNKTYNIKGKSYSHSELNKLGYTDDQINQAVKKGTIK